MSASFVHRSLVDAGRGTLDGHSIEREPSHERELLLRRARNHGMQGLIAAAVREHGSFDPWAVPFIEQAVGVREAHAQHVRTWRRAADAFGQLRIPRMVLKGPSLVERYYGDDALRPYGDVDVLVPPDRFEDALGALEGAGFTLLDRNWHLLRRDLRGQVHLRSPERDVLELHWHPVNAGRVRATLGVSASDLWMQASDGELAGAPVSIPRRAAELVHLCLHAAMHGCDRLIWLVDVSRAVDADDLDLDEVQRIASRWGFASGTYLVLALAHRWFGVPDRVLGAMRTSRPDPVAWAAFRRLVDRWDLGHPGADARLRQLLFATAGDGVARRGRLVWSLVVPPDVGDPDRPEPRIADHLRRLTLGTAERVRGKMAEHAHDGQLLEYRKAGDPIDGRARFVAEVATRGTAL